MRSECARTKELMAEYADGVLSGTDRRSLESHLQVCHACRKGYEDAREVRAIFASAPRFSAPAGLSGRVMRNLESRPVSETHSSLMGATLMRTMEAALILVVIAAGILSGNFLAAGLFPRAQDAAVAASRNGALLSYSIDAFDPAPPDSVAAAFVTVEDRNEK